PAVPERLREVWWVRRMPRLLAGFALAIAIVVPIFVTQSSRHQLYATILAIAICAVSVTVLTGWAGQLSLGQMAFAGVGALSAAAFARGASLNIGWHKTRLIHGTIPRVPFGLALLCGALFACAIAVIVGVGALRVKGLLLAISTMAFAIAAAEYLFYRPFFTGMADASTVTL